MSLWASTENFSDYFKFNESFEQAASDNSAVYDWALEAPWTIPQTGVYRDEPDQNSADWTSHS